MAMGMAIHVCSSNCVAVHGCNTSHILAQWKVSGVGPHTYRSGGWPERKVRGSIWVWVPHTSGLRAVCVPNDAAGRVGLLLLSFPVLHYPTGSIGTNPASPFSCAPRVLSSGSRR